MQFWRRNIDLRDLVGWSVFIIIVLMTCLVWAHLHRVIEENARKRFHEVAVMQRDVLINRMKDDVQIFLARDQPGRGVCPDWSGAENILKTPVVLS